jgi:outer membrane protein OmpA-like peptidoglycan-associated protein
MEIGGHTDNTGDADRQLALSQQRADAVRAYLIQQGVPEAMLVAKGYGDARPIASNDTEEGRFRNRRVEFTAR